MTRLVRLRRSRRSLRNALSTLVMVAGALLLLAPLAPLAYTRYIQPTLAAGRWTDNPAVGAGGERGTFASLAGRLVRVVHENDEGEGGEPEAPPPEPPPSTPPAEEPPQTVPSPAPADPVWEATAGYRLVIPRIGLDTLVFEGIDNVQLRFGPGHYANTPHPGEKGNAAIAGHRTVRGNPSFFYGLNVLEKGDTITVVYPEKSLTYAVERSFLTTATDLSVLKQTEYGSLTLTTCDPPGTDYRRLIVQAKLKGPAAGLAAIR